MSRRGTFTRRAAIGAFVLGALPCSSSSLLAAHDRQQRDRKSLDEILTSVFSETYQQLPFFDDCRRIGECLNAVKMNAEALYREGYCETYIQAEIKRNVSFLICKDFRESNVLVINGWVLSRTEAAICTIIGEKTKFQV